MKYIFLFTFTVLLFACKKNDNDQQTNGTLAAQAYNNVSYGTDEAEKMDVYLPAGRSADSTKTIIMIHGGAWSIGDKADIDSYVPVLKQRLPSYAIANINYRLASTTVNHFPAQDNDMKSAIDYLLQKTA